MKKTLLLLIFTSSQLFAQNSYGGGAASSTQSSSNLGNWIYSGCALVLATAGMTAIVATTGANNPTAH